MRAKHIIVANIVGLSPVHFEKGELIPNISHLAENGFFAPMKPSFPGVTCSVQASISTGTFPSEHGIVANGLYDRKTFQVSFWEQAESLVEREHIWGAIKTQNPAVKTAALFWQNTLYANSDIVITPKPIHTEDGMTQWCYSKPVGYYEEIAAEQGEFDLMSYWGPLASPKSSEWIVNAAIHTLRKERPSLLMLYMPHVDYSAQRKGPDSEEVANDLKVADDLIGKLLSEIDALEIRRDTAIIVLSEYSISQVNGAIALNVILREHGLLSCREIKGSEYVDFELSKAFAMVDHQIAHIYVKDGYVEQATDILRATDGVSKILGEDEKKAYKINHPRSGDLIAVSDDDKWFAYYWWLDDEKAPDFARKVDIHRKPGYDPLELFIDPKTMTIPFDTTLMKGSHGAPPTSRDEMASFLMSGDMIEAEEHPEEVDVTEVAPIIYRLLGIEHSVAGVSGPPL